MSMTVLKKLNKILSAVLALAFMLVLMPFSASAATSATINIPVQKIITGDVPETAESFEFTMTPDQASNPMPAGTVSGVKTVTQSGSGTVLFGEMSFATPGEYTYTLRETKGSNDDYTYDTTVYQLHILAANGASGLAATAWLTKPGDTDKLEKVIFTNQYVKPFTPPPANTGTLTITNTVTGGLGDKNKDFVYTITFIDSNGNKLTGSFPFTGGGIPGGTISSDGTVTLKDGQSIVISGLPVGTEYHVSQSDATTDGYTTTVQGAGGTINLSGNASHWFNNKEGGTDPTPTKIELDPMKTLDGVAPTGSQFTFYLKDEDGHIIQTKKNNGAAIAFDEIPYTTAGTYRYTMTEQVGTLSNMVYDGAVYAITVVVTEENGALKPTVTVSKDGAPYTEDKIVFHNTTRSTGGGGGGGGTTESSTTIRITKVWEDQSNSTGDRPGSVTVQLFRNGESYKTVQLTAENGWSYTLKNMPSGGTYSVVEETVEKYKASYSGSAASGFVVTNHFSPTTIDPGVPDEPETPGGEVTPPDPGDGENPSGSGESDDPNAGGNIGTSEGGTTGGNGGNSTGSGTSGHTPQTGDNRHTSLWIFLLLASSAGMVLTMKKQRMKSKN